MKYLMVMLMLGCMAACNPCKPGSVRCSGMVVEICRPDKRWAKVQDCSRLKRTKQQFDCAVRQVSPKKQKAFCRPVPEVPKPPVER